MCEEETPGVAVGRLRPLVEPMNQAAAPKASSDRNLKALSISSPLVQHLLGVFNRVKI